MAELGAGPEQIVALAIPWSDALVVGVLAALKTGAACCLLDPGQPADLLARLLADARPALVATLEGAAWYGFDGYGANCLVLDDPDTGELIRRHDATDLTDSDRRAPLRADHPAWVYYRPPAPGSQFAGVSVTHASVMNTLRWLHKEIPPDLLGPGDARRDWIWS